MFIFCIQVFILINCFEACIQLPPQPASGKYFTVSNDFELNVVFKVSATYENKQCDETHEIKHTSQPQRFLNEFSCGPDVKVKAVAQDNSALSCEESSQIRARNMAIVPRYQDGVLKCKIVK